jgi:hypothetical protein
MLGEMPAWRATSDTLMPGCMLSSTKRIFWAVENRRWRCTDQITSTRGGGPFGSEAMILSIGVCLCLIG